MSEIKSDRSDPRTPRARGLRKDATPAERKLWSALRLVELPQGHFRRQAPIGPYIADFAHHGLRLIVELDGEQHGYTEGLRRDAKRTGHLAEAGYRVLRLWNQEVMENCDGVVETILAAISEPPPTPALPATRSALGGREKDGEAARHGRVASRDKEQALVVPFPPHSGGEGTGGGRDHTHPRSRSEEAV